MANWGADFWGAYSDVAKARMAQAAFAQQQQGMTAFGRAMTDPNIFMPGVPQGGPQMGGGGPNPAQAPGNIQGLIDTSAKQYGVDPAFLTREAQIESNFNPNARNASGAAGLFQFMPKTANDMHLRNPMDPGQSANAAAALAVQNKGFLTKALGREPTNGELYLAHQQGAAGAAKLLANPNAPAASIVGMKAVVANGGKPNMTAGEFANMWTSKFAAQQAAPTIAQMGQPGQLNWQHIVQAIMAKNPGLAPAALAEAVQMFEPLMSQQSQMDWREQNLQLRELTEANRETQAQANEAGRNARAGAREQGVQGRFDAMQDVRYKGLEQRNEEFKQKMAASKTKADRDYYARQRKANNDQRHQRATELIARGSAMQDNPMTPEDQKAALDAEEQRWQTENDQIDAEAAGSAPQQPYQPGDQHPVPKGAVRAPGVDTLGNKTAGGKAYDENTAKKAYIDGGGSEAGWAYIKDKKAWMP